MSSKKRPTLRMAGLLGVATLALTTCGGTADTASTVASSQPIVRPSTTTSTSTTLTSTTSTTVAATTTTVLGELPEGDPVAGEEVFNTSMNVRNRDACSTCHSEAGAELGWGPNLEGIGEVAGERVPGLPAAHYLQQSITSTRAFILEGWSPHMPTSYGRLLSDQQLADLVEFLLQY